MKFVFNNIDKEYVKNRQEYMGDIQPKYWFYNNNHSILVKRQHSQKVSGQPQKSKMFNHFGEYFGYLLAKKAGIKACPVDLITLHDTKNKYSKSKHLYTACGSQSLLKRSQNLVLGETVVNAFAGRFPEKFQQIISQNTCREPKKMAVMDVEDDIDLVIAAIISQTIQYERQLGICSEDEIKDDVNENLQDAFNMFAYDCILGNNDRHSQNWAMCADTATGRMQMYPLYDNERILGLSKPEVEVRKAVSKDNLEHMTDSDNLSRMGISPIHTGVTYKRVLEHLVEKYPEYAIPAIQRLTDRIHIQDVDELYQASFGITKISEAANELTDEDELPQEYMKYGTTLFAERRAFARDLLERIRHQDEFFRSEREVDDLALV